MWPNQQFSADLVTFTEDVLSGKLHFLCSETIADLQKLVLTSGTSYKFGVHQEEKEHVKRLEKFTKKGYYQIVLESMLWRHRHQEGDLSNVSG